MTNKLPLLLLISLTIFLSCDSRCTDEVRAVMKAAEQGDLKAVKTYLENGGDPLLTCFDNEAGRFGMNRDLGFYIATSESKPLIKYYLTSYDIPAEKKDEMLETYIYRKNKDLIVLLLKHDAHMTTFPKKCYLGDKVIGDLDLLTSLNYDFNWVNPGSGNNILMEFARCPAIEESDDLVALLKYLKEKGVSTTLKNKEGKTALDIAVNEKAIAFLKSL